VAGVTDLAPRDLGEALPSRTPRPLDHLPVVVLSIEATDLAHDRDQLDELRPGLRALLDDDRPGRVALLAALERLRDVDLLRRVVRVGGAWRNGAAIVLRPALVAGEVSRNARERRLGGGRIRGLGSSRAEREAGDGERAQGEQGYESEPQALDDRARSSSSRPPARTGSPCETSTSSIGSCSSGRSASRNSSPVIPLGR
jgi:hypothetical protein